MNAGLWGLPGLGPDQGNPQALSALLPDTGQGVPWWSGTAHPPPALLPSLRLLCLHFHKRTQPLPAPPPQSTGSLAQDSRASTQPALAEHLLRARTLPGAQGSVRSRRHSPWGVHVGGAGGPEGTRAGSSRPPASLSHSSVRHAGKRFGGFLNDQTPVSPRTPG